MWAVGRELEAGRKKLISEAYDAEDSAAGHMMLPCSQFRKVSAQYRKEDVQIFLVGDYFEPQEHRAALQRLPRHPEAEKEEQKEADAKTFL